MAKRILIWAAVVIGLSLLVWGLIVAAKKPIVVTRTTLLATPVAATDQVLGSREAKVTLVEYSDYQCPACALYAPLVEQLAKDFSEDLLIVYRHFPLRSIHPNAQLAAQAGEAAALQGKFWEMSKSLFDNQAAWAGEANPRSLFEGYARELGLDVARFLADLESKAVKAKVDGDYDSGLASRVNSTPTFFLNDQVIENPRNYDEFAALVKEAIDAKK